MEISLSIQQYQELLTIALDFQSAQLKGGLVFDEYNPAAEGDKIMRSRLERLLKQKHVDSLEKMLQDLIERFRFRDEHNFAAILYEKTGYQLQPFPPEQICISTRRNIHIEHSGKSDMRLTSVVLELPTGSGSIYCVRGLHGELTADWLDAQIVEIRIPKVREEVQRVRTVRMYNEIISVMYKEE